MNKFKFWKLFSFSGSLLSLMILLMKINSAIVNNIPNPPLYFVLLGVLFLMILISLSHINDQLK